MSNKKQSSIEWLIGQLKISIYWDTLIAQLELMDLEIDDIVEQAKAMHKEEIIEAIMFGDCRGKIYTYSTLEEYYNETFNNKG